jgi:glycosyltransferase involved in cell wall biosynthesis
MWIWDYWPGPEGGSERQCRGLARELVRMGHTVTVVCACTGNNFPEMDQGVRIKRLNQKMPKLIEKLKKRERLIPRSYLKNEALEEAIRFWLEIPLWRKARRQFIREVGSFYIGLKEKPDLIHVHETGWLAGVGCWLAAQYQIPVVGKTRSTPALGIIGYDVPRRNFWRAQRKYCYWIALHEDLKNELMQSGVSSERISVVPNAVDVTELPPVKTSDGNTVLCVGNLTQGSGTKGFDVLIQAWAEVCRNHQTSRLVILGRGNPDGLKKLAHEYGCGDAVEFPGFVEDPGPYYQKAILFVLASYREGMSNALLEAQAQALPVVVSDIPANRAVAIEEETGLFFSPGDDKDLSRKILMLLNDPERAEKMGKEAHGHMKRAFSRASVTRQLLDVYKTLL